MPYELGLLDSPEEQAFDDLTVLASRLLHVPVSLVSLVDMQGDRQFFKSQVGLPEPVASRRETPLSHSFCKYVVQTASSLRVTDARLDDRVSDNPAIEELGVIAYLGHTIFSPRGTPIGSLCAIDVKPRDWSDEESDNLLRLSKMVSSQIASRSMSRTLIDEHRFLEDLLDTVSVGVTALDENGKVTFANPEACAIYGVPEHTFKGRAFNDQSWKISASDGGTFPHANLPVARVLAGEPRVRDVTFAFEARDGERRIISVDASRSKRALDKTAVICAVTDVTERFAAHAKLQEAVEASEAANRAKTAFLANMSHEIRTPLNGVMGLADLLLEQDLPPEPKQLIEAIHQSGNALLGVVNAVLDLSQIESGKLALAPKPFNLRDFVFQQHMLHASCAITKDIVFEITDGDIGAKVFRTGDEFRIGQVLGNLIGNAIKFTQLGSVVLSTKMLDDEMVEFSVTDTGIGMTESQVARVVQEFEQADSSTTRIYGGSGLGLSIVTKLVDLMGGQFSLESWPGKGTRATVRLPLPSASDPALSSEPSHQPPTPRVRSGLRVLVAEDNATNALILRKLLESQQIEVTFTSDGEEACAAWAPGLFDALIFDISMPVLDGVSALAKIQARCAREGVPMPYALAATANVLTSQTQAYLDAGFSGVLRKPYKKQELLQRLADITAINLQV